MVWLLLCTHWSFMCESIHTNKFQLIKWQYCESMWTLVAYGNIMAIDTTGASADTARQDGHGPGKRILPVLLRKASWIFVCIFAGPDEKNNNTQICPCAIGLPTKGVEASEQMARTDFERMKKYRSIIKKAADHYDVDPALIAAIISRESRAGNQLRNGWGDHGNAWGLMQVQSLLTHLCSWRNTFLLSAGW